MDTSRPTKVGIVRGCRIREAVSEVMAFIPGLSAVFLNKCADGVGIWIRADGTNFEGSMGIDMDASRLPDLANAFRLAGVRVCDTEPEYDELLADSFERVPEGVA